MQMIRVSSFCVLFLTANFKMIILYVAYHSIAGLSFEKKIKKAYSKLPEHKSSLQLKVE